MRLYLQVCLSTLIPLKERERGGVGEEKEDTTFHQRRRIPKCRHKYNLGLQSLWSKFNKIFILLLRATTFLSPHPNMAKIVSSKHVFNVKIINMFIIQQKIKAASLKNGGNTSVYLMGF